MTVTARKGFTHEIAPEGSTNVWLTPPEIVKALGPFDLDPCASEGQPWPTAAVHYTAKQDGLSLPWTGYVWMNPPYGAHAPLWVAKLAEHGNGIAFLYARTETRMFFRDVWPKAKSILFLEGRVRFYRPDGTPGDAATAPSCLIAYGDRAKRRLAEASMLADDSLRVRGKLVDLG